MHGKSIIMTASDEGYVGLLDQMLAAIQRFERWDPRDIAIFDSGLSEGSRARYARAGYKVIQPRWHFGLAPDPEERKRLGQLVRPFLREYAPNYEQYLWLDADTWVQSWTSVEAYLEGARREGMAIARERDKGYHFHGPLLLWAAKRLMLGCGAARGLWLLTKPHLNAGIFCMSADAPHWQLWRDRYRSVLQRTGQINPYDQIALNEVIYFDRPPTARLTAEHNWIADRGLPVWDGSRLCFCKPYPPFEPIGILHLAGAAKSGSYMLRTVAGGHETLSLRFQVATVAVLA